LGIAQRALGSAIDRPRRNLSMQITSRLWERKRSLHHKRGSVKYPARVFVRQSERAVRQKNPRPVWGYRPGRLLDASGCSGSGVCQGAGI